MKKKIFWKGVVRAIIPFVFVTVLLSPFFQSCQKEEMIEPEELTLKSAVEPEIYLAYPETDVVAGEDFDITFSSSCGKIMLERGFVEEYDEATLTFNKVYVGLTCETENLLWESVGEDVFETCAGETVTENIEVPGTYVYRTKLNMKAIKKSDCSECATLLGNQFECFMITVAECSQNTFTDERDGHVYKMITFGDQTWMAENLAYKTESDSYVYDNNEANVITCGRLYTWDAARIAAPEGWHVPSKTEWITLFNYLAANGYGYEGSGDDIAKALASTTGWNSSGTLGAPGNDQGSNNSSGFTAFPAGMREPNTFFSLFGNEACWWASDDYNSLAPYINLSYSYYTYQNGTYWKLCALSVRCVKD